MNSDEIQPSPRYPSDLSDEEWEILRGILDKIEPYKTGRRRTSDLREILNAIFYLNKTGCPWRYLPKDFPPYRLVNDYYNKWTHHQVLEKVNLALCQDFREKKIVNRIRREQSLTVKASRELPNRQSNRDLTAANS